MQVETWGLLAGRQRTIALQLKSTVNPNFVDGGAHVTYDLPRATYDDLFAPATVPRFLVIVAVSRPPDAVGVGEQHAITLSAAAWWGELTMPSNGSSSQRVKIPTTQRLDGDGLHAMLLKA
jgi:hypothetical protein